MTVLLVILNILKIIGFILLGIIGFLLILLLAVLILPIHYRIEGLSEDEMMISARVTYMARFVCAKVSFAKESGLEILATILWGHKKVYPNAEPDYTRDFVTEDTPSDRSSKAAFPHADEKADEDTSSLDISAYSDVPADEDTDDEPEVDITSQEASEDSAKDSKKDRKKRRKKEKHGKKEKVALREKIKTFKETWLTASNGRAVLYIKKQLAYILRKYLPRRAKGHLAYSTGDPALTGEIYGAMWLLPFMYKGRFTVTPDFEAEKFYAKGILTIGGFIQPGVVVIALIRLIINKDTRNLFKLFIDR